MSRQIDAEVAREIMGENLEGFRLESGPGHCCGGSGFGMSIYDTCPGCQFFDSPEAKRPIWGGPRYSEIDTYGLVVIDKMRKMGWDCFIQLFAKTDRNPGIRVAFYDPFGTEYEFYGADLAPTICYAALKAVREVSV